MNKPRLEAKVGLFVFIGLVLLAGLLIQFSKGASLFRKTYELQLRAPNVGGLKIRSGVLLSGVQVGTVSNIKLTADGKSVTIFVKIYKEFPIYRDARFVIEQSGFLGDQFVAIIPRKNEGERFQDGDEATIQEPFNLQEVARSASGFIQRIDETAKKLNDSISDIRRLLLNEETLTNLAVAVGNMRSVSERALVTVDHLNVLIDTNGPAVGVALSNVVFFSEEINRFAGSFGSVLATNSSEITAAVKNIGEATEVLKGLLVDVQDGKGLAGSLLRNEILATNIAVLTDNLAITSSNLNRLGLWGILWSKKPARTNRPPETITAPKRTF